MMIASPGLAGAGFFYVAKQTPAPALRRLVVLVVLHTAAHLGAGTW
jgi:hypothetical protein